MNDDLTKLSIDYIARDHEHYTYHKNYPKMQITEHILRVLHKEVIFPVPRDHFNKGKCYICGVLKQNGHYCSYCGQRLK